MLSIILPAHNESKRILSVVQQALRFADEVLVIDDGSQDDTATVAEYAGAKVIRQENKGYLAAVKKGFQEAHGDVLITMDADGEHDALDIQRLVWFIESDQADMVLGKRFQVARPSERLISFFTWLKTGVYDTGTGMRAISRELALRLTLPGRCICGTSVLEAYHLGARIREVPIFLHSVDKPRNIAWGHAAQIGHVACWILKN